MFPPYYACTVDYSPLSLRSGESASPVLCIIDSTVQFLFQYWIPHHPKPPIDIGALWNPTNPLLSAPRHPPVLHPPPVHRPLPSKCLRCFIRYSIVSLINIRFPSSLDFPKRQPVKSTDVRLIPDLTQLWHVKIFPLGA